MSKFEKTYDKHYKKLLILPALLLILSILSITIFYYQNGDLFNKDVSLTGGTTITIFSETNLDELGNILDEKIGDFEIRALSDSNGKQTQISVIVQEEKTELLKSTLENFLGYKLTQSNSSIETTSASLSANFYKQLMVAVTLAFFWMAGVVFLIFTKGKKIKSISLGLNLLLGILLGGLFTRGQPTLFLIAILTTMISLIYIYIKNSVPSFAVMLSAFADITMTLAVVNLLGIQVSTAGIVAFLMLIGYSVDTDVLLTTRVLQRKTTINHEVFSSFKTGITMTLTSIVAISVALFVVAPFGSSLNQIFTIVLIGLGFDLFNTWITNASIIKWYAEAKK